MVVAVGRATASQAPATTATIVVEAKDLDTEARSRESIAVSAPRDASHERRQLQQAATGLRPAAKMRSFADGAATFLDRQHLLVAYYVERPEGGR